MNYEQWPVYAIAVVGVVFGAFLGVYAGRGFWLVNGLLAGLGGGLVGGMFGVIVKGLKTPIDVTPPAPGKAIQRSLRTGMLSGLVYGIAWGTVVGLAVGVLSQRGAGLGIDLRAGLGAGLIVWWFMGLAAALDRGGGAFLRHHLLRWVLIRDGFAPRDYVAFLESASQAILLRRRGGGYEFFHGLLLEHFASLEPGSLTAHASVASS